MGFAQPKTIIHEHLTFTLLDGHEFAGELAHPVGASASTVTIVEQFGETRYFMFIPALRRFVYAAKNEMKKVGA